MNSDAVPTMNMHMAYGDFTRGAEWADKHPNQSFLLEALRDLEEVKKALQKIDNMDLDGDVANEVYYAKYKLDDAIEGVGFLINEED